MPCTVLSLYCTTLSYPVLSCRAHLIITTLPVTICYSLYFSFPEGDSDVPDVAADPTWRRHMVYSNIRTLVEEMGLSHYACNFYIYLMTGRVFRRELRRLLCRSDANSEFAAGQRLA